jgi:hypothetical protein
LEAQYFSTNTVFSYDLFFIFPCKTCDVIGPWISCGQEINGTETTWNGQDQTGSPLMTGINYKDQLAGSHAFCS